jgi:uncharacterized protein YfbU (UPF0304 family)
MQFKKNSYVNNIISKDSIPDEMDFFKGIEKRVFVQNGKRCFPVVNPETENFVGFAIPQNEKRYPKYTRFIVDKKYSRYYQIKGKNIFEVI